MATRAHAGSNLSSEHPGRAWEAGAVTLTRGGGGGVGPAQCPHEQASFPSKSGPKWFRGTLPRQGVRREQSWTCGGLLGLLDMLLLPTRPCISDRECPGLLQSPHLEPAVSPSRIGAFRAVPTLPSPSREQEEVRCTHGHTWLLPSSQTRQGQALFLPQPFCSLPFTCPPPLPCAQSAAATSVLLSPETPTLQPSRLETLIKLFENPIKMLYESVCHWQRFREEN